MIDDYDDCHYGMISKLFSSCHTELDGLKFFFFFDRDESKKESDRLIVVVVGGGA